MLALDAWNKWSDEIPIFRILYNKIKYKLLLDGVDIPVFGVFGNDPDQNFDILFTPVFLNPFIFYHSRFYKKLLLDSKISIGLNLLMCYQEYGVAWIYNSWLLSIDRFESLSFPIKILPIHFKHLP